MLLRDEQTERCLFAGILADPGVLEWCDAVESDDFSCLHLKYAFGALRNLQAHGRPITLDSIAAELERLGNIQVDMARIYDAIAEGYVYSARWQVDDHIRWLRRLARRRAVL